MSSEENLGADVDDSSDFLSMREMALGGRTPQEYIVQQVASFRADYERMASERSVPSEGPLTKHDIAYYVQSMIDWGFVTEDEVASCVGRLGLTEEEQARFVVDTLPESREYMAEDRERRMREFEEKKQERAERFCRIWGIERMDAIAGHYGQHLSELQAVNQYWDDTLARYRNGRQQLLEQIEAESDPIKRARLIMRQLYSLYFIGLL